jgi:hypothetical protein
VAADAEVAISDVYTGAIDEKQAGSIARLLGVKLDALRLQATVRRMAPSKDGPVVDDIDMHHAGDTGRRAGQTGLRGRELLQRIREVDAA